MHVLNEAKGRSPVWICALLLTLSSSAGCKKAASPSESPGMEDGRAYEGLQELAELAELEQRMRVLGLGPSEGQSKDKQRRAEEPSKAANQAGAGAGVDRDQLAGEGEAAPEAEPSADSFEEAEPAAEPVEQSMTATSVSPADTGGDSVETRCANLCALNEAICELEIRICEMSESHAEDEVYTDACVRAIDDCEVSGEACDMCRE